MLTSPPSSAITYDITSASTTEDIYSAFNLTTDEEHAKLSIDVKSKTLTLNDSITLSNSVRLTGGDWTLLGSGNTITLKDSILIHENASLSLGKNNSRKASALTLTSNDDTRSILDLQGSATLSMYDGVTLSSSKSTGRPGAIDLNDNSQFLMHGGKIINCDSTSVAGDVYVKDTSQFLMYDGVINNCSGWEGGALGIADGSTAIGGSSGSDGKFHMYGGEIKNCSDCYEGGGAVCILSWRAENHGCFVMDGGTITDCYTEDSSEYGGGAIYINAKDANANINGGSITKNHTAKTGGGIYIRSGAASVSPEVKL